MLPLVLVCLAVATVFGGHSDQHEGKQRAGGSTHRPPPPHRPAHREQSGAGSRSNEEFSSDEHHQCNVTGNPRDCQAPFQQMADCGIKVFNDNMEKIRARFESKKAVLIKCFTDNGCSDPTTLKDDPKEAQAAKCTQALMKKGFNEVKDCIQHNLPECPLPNIDISNFTSKIHMMHPDFIRQVLNKSCSNHSSQEVVGKCLYKQFQNDTEAMKHEHEDFCNKEKACFDGLSGYCKCQFGKVMKQGANCTMQIFTAHRGNFTAGTPECDGVQFQAPPANDGEQHARRQRRTAEHGGFGMCESFSGYQQSNYHHENAAAGQGHH